MVAKEKTPDEINEVTLRNIRDKPIPRTFHLVLPRYEAAKKVLANRGVKTPMIAVADTFRDIITGSREDIAKDLAGRLPAQMTTDAGRSYQFQGLVKNAGENFTSLVAYNLAENLMGTGWAVVRGKPVALKDLLNISMTAPDGTQLNLPIEADVTIFRPDDLTAVVLSAKTTFKERAHGPVMWRLIIEAAKNEEWAGAMRMEPSEDGGVLERLKYCFVTADLGERGDLAKPRNLIKADASLLDFCFVARDDLAHIERSIGSTGRKSIFHRLSAIYELLESL